MATDEERNRGAGAFSTPGVDIPAARPPYVTATSGPQVTFKFLNVEPPTSVYISRDDLLLFRVWNSVPGVNVGLHVRVLRPDGVLMPNDFPTFPSSNRVLNSTVLNITEGYLLSCAVFAAGATIARGQCFVQVGVIRGGLPGTLIVQGLISDYVVTPQFLTFPGGTFRSSTEGPGVILRVAGSNPAAGADRFRQCEP